MHRLLRKKLMPVRSGGASPGAVPQGEEKSLYSLFYLGFVLIIVWSTDLQSYNFLIKVMPWISFFRSNVGIVEIFSTFIVCDYGNMEVPLCCPNDRALINWHY